MKPLLVLGWLMIVGGSLAGGIAYVLAGDGWRAAALLAVFLLALILRDTLTNERL